MMDSSWFSFVNGFELDRIKNYEMVGHQINNKLNIIEHNQQLLVFFYTNNQLDQFKVFANTLKKTQTSQIKINVPGLNILQQFVEEQEEQQLLEFLETQKWTKQQNIKFQVFGYDKCISENNRKRLPEILDRIKNRIEIKIGSEINEVKVIKLKAGQGIPYHQYSHKIYADKMFRLVLKGNTVMCFNNGEHSSQNLYTRARDLVEMGRDCRLQYFYSILQQSDDYCDQQQFYEIRQSVIFVEFNIIKNEKDRYCDCGYKYCDSKDDQQLKTMSNTLNRNQKGSYMKIVENNEHENELIKQDIDDRLFQQKYVDEVYQQISLHFSETRKSLWPKVVEFIDSLEPGSVLLDLGCGNSKYCEYILNRGIYLISCDNNSNFCQISNSRAADNMVLQADILKVPIKKATVDNVICIAVIHHLKKDRKQCIEQILGLVREGGRLMVYVWAYEQDNLVFKQQDVFVPWNLSNQDRPQTILKRYYHVFKYEEIQDLFRSIQGIFIEQLFYDKSNWVVVVRKQSCQS